MAAREAIAEQDDQQGGTYRLELVSCGKPNCTRCAEGPAHGPYWYRYYRRGAKVVSKYVGKTLPAADAAFLERRGDIDAGTARMLTAPAPPAGTRRDQEIADAVVRGLLERMKPEVRQAIEQDMPGPMRDEVDAAIRRAEQAERDRRAKAGGPAGAQARRGPRDGKPAADYRTATAGEARDHVGRLQRAGVPVTFEDAGLLPDGGARTPEPAAGAAPAPVSGQLSSRPPVPNRWGTFASADYPVNFHEDGMIGLAIRRMGTDRRLDVDGEPLADVLGRAATDAVVGRASSQQVLDRVKQLRDRLPHGGAARRELDDAISKLDAPSTPPPPVPAGTLEPLRQLMTDLHAIPLVRRDPSREQAALTRTLGDWAQGKLSGARLIHAVRTLRNQRHESAEGKFEIDRAIDAALDGLEEIRRSRGRQALYPPSAQ